MGQLVTPSPLTASMLFARSLGLECKGNWRCHWCGAPCNDKVVHDDPPPVPFVRSKSTARCPAEPYVCVGCHRFAKGRASVKLLAGGQRDGGYLRKHSWFITEEGAWVVDRGDGKHLYPVLLKPPRKFVLMLLTDPGLDNLLQLGTANDPGGVIAETPLHFTVNNIPHTFSVYELEESIRHGPEPYGPGVRALLGFLGEVPGDVKKKYPTPVEEAKARGRPPAKEDAKYTTKKVVVASGEAA